MNNEQFLSLCVDITFARQAWASSPELRANFHNNIDEFIEFRTAPARRAEVELPAPALSQLAGLQLPNHFGSFE